MTIETAELIARNYAQAMLGITLGQLLSSAYVPCDDPFAMSFQENDIWILNFDLQSQSELLHLPNNTLYIYVDSVTLRPRLMVDS